LVAVVLSDAEIKEMLSNNTGAVAVNAAVIDSGASETEEALSPLITTNQNVGSSALPTPGSPI